MWPFRKRKEGKEKFGKLSELPKLPELPPFPKFEPKVFQPAERHGKIKDELPPLPSFPRSSIGEEVSRETIKEAVKEPYVSTIRLPNKPKTREIEERVPITRVVKEIRPEIKTEPIFVRIDKYRQAMSDFQDIKKELMEIENLLKDIKEIRAREEAELQTWQEEIRAAKERLESIDKTIFQKLQE